MNCNYMEMLDKRNEVRTVFCKTTVKEYLDFIKQQDLLTENTMDSQRKISFSGSKGKIRIKMIEDIAKGGSVPPIILGVLSNNFPKDMTDFKVSILSDEIMKQVLIIDGQHRTFCIEEAYRKNSTIKDDVVVLTLLITDKMSVLFDRMMVLNIGQMPWDTKQQARALYRFYYKEIQNFDNPTDAFNFMEHFYIYYNASNKHSYQVNFKAEIDITYANSDLLSSGITDDEKTKLQNFKSIYIAAGKAINFFPKLDSSISKAFCYVIKQVEFNTHLEKICNWFIDKEASYYSDGAYEDELSLASDFPSQKGINRREYSEFVLTYLFQQIIQEPITQDNLIDILIECAKNARNTWNALHSRE